MNTVLLNCYVIVAVLLCICILIEYGREETLSPSRRMFNDVVDVLGGVIYSILWPCMLGALIILGVFEIPILFGKYIGNKEKKYKVKKEFKEKINKK